MLPLNNFHIVNAKEKAKGVSFAILIASQIHKLDSVSLAVGGKRTKD